MNWMKTIIKTMFMLAALAGAFCSHAATVILDDFSTGPFSIGTGIGTSDGSVISSPIADTRRTWGTGANPWSSTLDDVAGVLSYSLSLPQSAPSSDTRLAISYRSSVGNNLNLVGYDAFVIHVGSIEGTGQILAFVGAAPPLDVVPVSLSGAGEVVIPFDNMKATNPTSPSSVTFWIIPHNKDFSVTLDGISVIPEPSAIWLAAMGASVLLVRRR